MRLSEVVVFEAHNVLILGRKVIFHVVHVSSLLLFAPFGLSISGSRFAQEIVHGGRKAGVIDTLIVDHVARSRVHSSVHFFIYFNNIIINNLFKNQLTF